MTVEDVFKEVLKSPELQSVFNIPKDELEKECFYNESQYEIIEIVRTLLTNKFHRRSNESIYNTLKNQIMG